MAKVGATDLSLNQRELIATSSGSLVPENNPS
jgi:hypothetical protein